VNVEPASLDDRPLLPDREGVSFRPGDVRGDVVDVLFDGRRIWSFRVDEAQPIEDDSAAQRFRRASWPEALRPFLDGWVTVGLREVEGDVALAATEVQLGSSPSRVRVEDSNGRPLVVNKWGGLGRALVDTGEDATARLLGHVDAIRSVLIDELGLDAFITFGTLLGSVRTGHLITHDDDADLGYLSAHNHPAEVARESFAVGRALRRHGYTAVRLSAGHIQMQFAHEGLADFYVDVFSGWHLGGWWYQVFCVRAQVPRSAILPTTSIVVEGRPEPAPKDPERMLEAIYGPRWSVPDPAFKFEIPHATGRRFLGWFRDLNVDREYWESYHAADRAPNDELGRTPSPLARWTLAHRLEGGESILDVGCGRGDDALWLAAQGWDVYGIDHVRGPLALASTVSRERGSSARFEVVNLSDVRTTVRLGAWCAAQRRPWVLHGSGLLDALGDDARSHLLRLISMVVRVGGHAVLDLADSPEQIPQPRRGRRAQPLDPQRLVDEMTVAGLRVLDVSSLSESSLVDGRHGDTPGTRTVMTCTR
jgi:SAM-dependent methyltransferase